MASTATPRARYRIAEVARLSGFTPTTLRFYEQSGVLPRPERTAAGYRTYDDRDLDRLRLIARAKDLGCTLEEVAELVEAWDADRCGPVKHRLRSLVRAKIAGVEDHIAEQVAFADQLRATAEALADRPLDGPCDETCGCTTVISEAERVTDDSDGGCGCATDEPPRSSEDSVGGAPIACSLDHGGIEARIEEWQAVLSAAESRQATADGLRIRFGPAAPVAEIARLAAAEHDCCPFFTFALTIDPNGVALQVTAPAGGQPLLRSLFEAA